MADVDIDVRHATVTPQTDNPAYDVSANAWNHHHVVGEHGISAVMLPARTTAQYTTASLANAAEETGNLTLSKGYRLLHIETDRPARVRLYVSSAQRTADASRPVGTDPTGDHGCLLDFVTTSQDLSWDLSPVVDGFCDSSSIPISITNMGTTGAVTLTFTYQPTEG